MRNKALEDFLVSDIDGITHAGDDNEPGKCKSSSKLLCNQQYE